jgi:hypothetical protein
LLWNLLRHHGKIVLSIVLGNAELHLGLDDGGQFLDRQRHLTAAGVVGFLRQRGAMRARATMAAVLSFTLFSPLNL